MFEVDDSAVLLVEIDYQYEAGSPGIATTGTLRLANKEYFDDVGGYVYTECINGVPQFSRSLSGERLGDYRSTIGTVEIDNADGEFDYVLALALDGSEVRVYWGDRAWTLPNFRLVFSALATKAVAPSVDRISIQLKDAAVFLNKSIGGVPVDGAGPNADQSRPLNFGYVHQIACLVYDQATLTYVHSDAGSAMTAANVVRDNGIEVNFVDNGDGTFYLEQSPVNPTGAITADVLAVASGSPADTDERRFSHAMRYLIGERAGLAAIGRYAGPSSTFTPFDDDDYFVGVSLPEARNIVDLLGEMVDSGNAYWCITRLGQFTYGRLNPHELEAMTGSPSTTVEIEADDIDDGSIKIDHTSPKYYKLQAYMSRNWSTQNVFATSLTPDERAILTRKGLYLIQADSIGTSYAEAPELYSLSLTVSPPLDTLLSGFDDETDIEALGFWMERRRIMFLPWLETISFTVGIEFYELDIGDVVRLTLPRFGLDAGELFQIVGVDIQLSKAKVGLQLLRRRTSEVVPQGFERDTIDDTRLITGIGVPQIPLPPAKPPVVIDPTPPIFPWPPPIVNILHPTPRPDLFWWDTFNPDQCIELLYVHDTFTGSNGTTLAAHTADLGSPWFLPPLTASSMNVYARGGSVYPSPRTFALTDFVIEDNQVQVAKSTGGEIVGALLTGTCSTNYTVRIDLVTQYYGALNDFSVELYGRYQNESAMMVCQIDFGGGTGPDAQGNESAYAQLFGDGTTFDFTGSGYFNPSAKVGPGPNHTIVWDFYANEHVVIIDGYVAIRFTDSNPIVSGLAGWGVALASDPPDADFRVDDFRAGALCPHGPYSGSVDSLASPAIGTVPYTVISWDGFDEAGPTNAVSHTGDYNITWARPSAWSNNGSAVDADNAMIIGRFFGFYQLGRPDSGGNQTGEALIYASTVLSGGVTEFYLQFAIDWFNGHDAFVAVYEQADQTNGPPSSALLFRLAINGGTSHTTGTSGDVGDFTWSPAAHGEGLLTGQHSSPPHLLRLEINRTNLTLYADSEIIRTWARSSQPAGKFGVCIGDTDGVAAINVSDFKIVTGL